MAAVGGVDGAKSASFRWLDAARYAVAAVMTVLIIAVIAKAIKVVLRPDSLYLFVMGGSMSSTTDVTTATVALDLQLRGQNPSGRVRMYYTNVSAYLFDNSTSAWTKDDPGVSCMALVELHDITVPQQQTEDAFLHWVVDNVSMASNYFDILYKNGSINDVTLRLDGLLFTEFRANRSCQTSYFCGPLLIGGGPGNEAFLNRDNVLCKEQQRGQLVQ
ncbi:unnamed protein product [Urochloa decumbens]|uniref:Late embryogenesis abundant protein LEA-2 subgroup domain-containing protein n=1 Tax=Urochloa decumbens TaxID=240449 RepID=A0ABC9DUN5_9POAL